MMNVQTSKNCPICGGTGWRPLEKDGLRAVEICDCRRQQRDRRLLERARIPRRYSQCDFESFGFYDNQSLQNAVVKANGFVREYPPVDDHDKGRGLFFLGNPGVGKTHLTVAILKQLMEQKGVECLFCPFQDLLKQIRDSYDPVSLSTESQVLQPVLQTEVVAIDDLGANRISDWVEDTITHILNHRYNERKTTLLTSNLPDTPQEVQGRSPSGKYRIGDTLEDRIGKRVRSRLYEMCEVVKIDANDYRQTVLDHSH